MRSVAITAGLVIVALAGAGVLTRRVQRMVSGEAVPTATLGEPGKSPGQFEYPRAIDADPTGLWIIDKAARVQRIDPTSGLCTAIWTLPEFALGKPTGVTCETVRGESLVMVPDTHYHRILFYRPRSVEQTTLGEAPELLASVGSFGRGDGEFIYPTDVAFTHHDDGSIHRMYVSEYGGNDRVSIFERDVASAPFDLRFVRSFGMFGTAEDPSRTEFNRAQSVVVDAQRNEVVVADACNHRLGRFTLDGVLIGWIGAPASAGNGAGELKYPYGLKALGDGTVLVAEYGNGRIQRIELDSGRSLGAYEASKASGMMTPWGVTARDGVAFALDSGHSRVIGFDLESLIPISGGASR